MAITISITSGTGYFGSVYTQTGAAGAGQWYADDTAISGETGNTYTMTAANEGKVITYRTASPAERSNRIQMFVPSLLAGLVTWWDAAREDLITKDGSNVVSAVAPRIGTVGLSQATAGNRPTWSATGRNGRPAFAHNGSQVMPMTNTGLLPVGGNPSTFFGQAAYSASGASTWRSLVSYGGASQRTRRDMVKDLNNNVALGGGTFDIQTAISWLNTDRIYCSTVQAAGAALFVDGTAAGTQGGTFNTVLNDSNVGGGLSNTGWNGTWQDILIYNSILSVADRQMVEGYLASKWGTRASLPAGHPYKSTNPSPPIREVTAALSGLLPTASGSVVRKGEIAITAGGGYFGSTYTTTATEDGQWYADETPIAGATGKTWVMTSALEGRSITYRTNTGQKSNRIKLFTPNQITGILTWWDASRPDLFTYNGAKVVTWQSRVGGAVRGMGNGDDAQRPNYSATGRSGLPAVVFPNTNLARLGFADLSYYPIFGDPVTQVQLAYAEAGIVDRVFSIFADTQPYRALNNAPGTGFVGQYSGNAPYVNVSNVPWPGFDRIVFSEVRNNGQTLYIDGGPAVSTPATISVPNRNNSWVGGHGGAGGRWAGSMQDIMLFNKVLSTTERQLIEGYLAGKWNTRVNLPSDHPYKTASPMAQATSSNNGTAALSGLLPTASGSVDTEAGTLPTISITSGLGYAGSVYTRTPAKVGNWTADGVAIPGETGATLTMTLALEGKTIRFRTGAGKDSNRIRLFMPAQLPNLILNFDAFDTTNMTMDGNRRISAWKSKVSAHSANQSTTADMPTHVVSGVNGLPTVTVASGDDATITGGVSLPTANAGHHIIALAAPASGTTERTLLTWGSATSKRSLDSLSQGGIAMSFGTSAAAVNKLTVNPADWRGNTRIVSAAHLPASGSMLAVDGQGAPVTGVPDGNSTAVGTQRLFNNTASIGSWAGMLQELVLFGAPLSRYDRQRMEGYMAARWNQRALLPADHPYKAKLPPADMAADLMGYLPTMSGMLSPASKFMGDLPGRMPFMSGTMAYPVRVNGDLNAMLPMLAGTLRYKPNFSGNMQGRLPVMAGQYKHTIVGDLAAFSFLPTADGDVEFRPGFSGDLVGFLPVSYIGAGQLFEIDGDMQGRLPVMAGFFEQAAAIEAEGDFRTLLPALSGSFKWRAPVTGAWAGYLPRVDALGEQDGLEIVGNLVGYLPRGTGGGNGGGDRQYAVAAGFTSGGTINVGGGPNIGAGTFWRLG